MRRCTTFCTRNFREAGLNSQPRRWVSYDKSALTKEALLLDDAGKANEKALEDASRRNIQRAEQKQQPKPPVKKKDN